MRQPTLVIMAAGIGSRFGGLKQLAPVGIHGEPIIDFSLYDAIEAGFRHVVFIIKEEIEEEFRALVDGILPPHVRASYVRQSLDALPKGFSPPADRIKPWGTSHAILCAKQAIEGPFAVINADDYYGKDAFRVIFDHLQTQEDDDRYRFSMVGYPIENTLTDNGHVTRGVCRVEDGTLSAIDERMRIERHGERIEFTEDEGATWTPIPAGTTVSMNLWGLSPGFLEELERRFPDFLNKALASDPLKAEYLLPRVIGDLVGEGKATVQVLTSRDQWYGVTYKEDLEPVARAIQDLQRKGLYPERLGNGR